MSMSRLLNGHLHPLLVHFPIGLVLTAAMAETVALATGIKKWRVVAVANLRLGSVFALAAAATGWLLAASSAVEDAPRRRWTFSRDKPEGCTTSRSQQRRCSSRRQVISVACWCGAWTSCVSEEEPWRSSMTNGRWIGEAFCHVWHGSALARCGRSPVAC